MKNINISKKGVSDVVTNVLLVLIAIAAVAIISAFVIPYVRNSLEGSTTCTDLKDYASVVDLGKNCYNSSNTLFSIERGLDNITIKGFIVSITAEGQSKRYDISYNKDSIGILMLNKTSWVLQEQVPQPGEARTYMLDIANGEKVKLAILSEKGKSCDLGNYDISRC